MRVAGAAPLEVDVRRQDAPGKGAPFRPVGRPRPELVGVIPVELLLERRRRCGVAATPREHRRPGLRRPELVRDLEAFRLDPRRLDEQVLLELVDDAREPLLRHLDPLGVFRDLRLHVGDLALAGEEIPNEEREGIEDHLIVEQPLRVPQDEEGLLLDLDGVGVERAAAGKGHR